jgi:hypothetical protein
MQKLFVTRVFRQTYRPQYLSWLNAWPAFPRQNRRVNFNWRAWTGGPYHVAQLQSRYRELLLGLCHLERAFMTAQDRFEHAFQHEKPLAEFRVLASREELENALKLLPLHYLESELSTMLFLIRTMPPRLFAQFHNVHATFYASFNELITDIADLQHIYALKSQITQGSHVAQLALTVHLQTSGIQRELKSKFSEDRLSRLKFKQQDGEAYDYLSPLLAPKERASDNLKRHSRGQVSIAMDGCWVSDMHGLSRRADGCFEKCVIQRHQIPLIDVGQGHSRCSAKVVPFLSSLVRWLEVRRAWAGKKIGTTSPRSARLGYNPGL